MSQSSISTEQATQDTTLRSREHYADLVSKYFRLAHSNRLKEVVAMFTDDAFATFVVAPEPFYGKEAIRGFYAQLFHDFPHIEPEMYRGGDRGQPRDHRAEDDHHPPRRHPRGHALQYQPLHLRGGSHQDVAGDGEPGLRRQRRIGAGRPPFRSGRHVEPTPDVLLADSCLEVKDQPLDIRDRERRASQLPQSPRMDFEDFAGGRIRPENGFDGSRRREGAPAVPCRPKSTGDRRA